MRDEGDGRVYYVARPIVAHDACLAFHDTPQRAPAGMVAKYGPVNGFGWKANEVVAIQSLTVPAAEELKETGELALILGGGLLVVFIAVYFALTISIIRWSCGRSPPWLRPPTGRAATARAPSCRRPAHARSASFPPPSSACGGACRKP